MEQQSCVNPNCNESIYARGLCHACYLAASRLVKAGKITWEALEASGRALPVRGRKREFGPRARWILGEVLE